MLTLPAPDHVADKTALAGTHEDLIPTEIFGADRAPPLPLLKLPIGFGLRQRRNNLFPVFGHLKC